MAIFPEVEVTEEEIVPIVDRGINFLYDFEVNDFIMKDGKLIELTGDAAVVFWIEKTLRTEYEKSAVYESTEYGTVLESVRGKTFPLDLTKTLLEDNFKDSLLRHERIKAITGFKLSKDSDKLNISFNVELTELTPEEETGISSEDGFTRISTLEEIKEFIGIKLVTSNFLFFTTNLGTQVLLGGI